MKIIVGLGNPGKEYEKTRHNTGWRVLDALAKKLVISNWQLEKKIFNAEIIEKKVNKEKIILVRPLTFMNRSGEAVKTLITNYKLPITNLWVIHDESDLPLGTLRIVKNRGPAGHKGVESIIRRLETEDFVRFRVGVGSDQKINPPAGGLKDQKEYVLEEFKGEEEKLFKEMIEKMAEAVVFALKYGLEKAMNKYN